LKTVENTMFASWRLAAWINTPLILCFKNKRKGEGLSCISPSFGHGLPFIKGNLNLLAEILKE
jgi:hypothetical protein